IRRETYTLHQQGDTQQHLHTERYLRYRYPPCSRLGLWHTPLETCTCVAVYYKDRVIGSSHPSLSCFSSTEASSALGTVSRGSTGASEGFSVLTRAFLPPLALVALEALLDAFCAFLAFLSLSFCSTGMIVTLGEGSMMTSSSASS